MCAKPILLTAGNRDLGKVPVLKYNSGGTDLDRLRTELGVGEGRQDNHDHASSDTADRYSDFDEYDGEEEDEYDGEVDRD